MCSPSSPPESLYVPFAQANAKLQEKLDKAAAVSKGSGKTETVRKEKQRMDKPKKKWRNLLSLRVTRVMTRVNRMKNWVRGPNLAASGGCVRENHQENWRYLKTSTTCGNGAVMTVKNCCTCLKKQGLRRTGAFCVCVYVWVCMHYVTRQANRFR